MVYIVYIERTSMHKTLNDRIAKLGDRVFMDTGLYLVKSTLVASEITALLTAPPYDNVEVFVAELHPEEGNTFGLWRSTNLWSFLGLYSDENQQNEETIENKDNDA